MSLRCQITQQTSKQPSLHFEGWDLASFWDIPRLCLAAISKSDNGVLYKILEIEKSQKYVPIEKSFSLKICLKKAYFMGFFFPGSRPWIPGKRECQKSGNSREFPVPGFPADSTNPDVELESNLRIGLPLQKSLEKVDVVGGMARRNKRDMLGITAHWAIQKLF